MSTDTNRWMILLLLAALALGLLGAQTLDTGILGRVTDPSGAVISGANITVTQTATGVSHTATTDASGHYEVRYLVPGEYAVEAKAQGFRTERQTGIVIQIGQQAPIDFSLQVGSVVETVDVNAAAPLAQTENATLGEVVGTERIVNLPLNGRNFAQLAVLAPGVRIDNSGNVRTRIIADGARDINMQISVDGVTAVNNRHNFIVFYPSIDAIQEFKVQTGNYSAEYGGNAGVNVNVQLRSGTNQLHGTMYDFLRNNHLDARGYFRPEPFPKDQLRRNQFGGILSGPIRKDKTFYLISYEGQRQLQESPGTSIVLTPAQRQGNFSDSSRPVIDPTTGAQFPGNIVPSSRLNPVATNLLQYMPLPNSTGTVNYNGVTRGLTNIDQGIARVDHYFSERDQVFVHYIYSARDYPSYDLNPNFYFGATFPNTSFAGQYLHTFSPTLLNEVRFGWQKGHVQLLSPRQNTSFRVSDLGINGMNVGGPSGRPLTAPESGFPVIGISGYLGLGDDQASSNLDDSRTYQWVDNLSIIHGRHSMKMGVDARRLLDDATTNNWPFGQIAFTGDITGNAAADYMLGFPKTTLTPEGVPITKSRQWRFGFYFQDDWKVSEKLTLNLGIRYDLIGLPHDISGIDRTLRFDMGPQPVLWPTPGQQADLWLNEYWHIGPRVGFAYRLDNKTVVRGGYGIFTAANHFDNLNILQLNPPAAGSLTVTNPNLNPVATLQDPVPAALYPVAPIFNVVSIPPDRRHLNAYIQNFTFMASREFTRNDMLEVGWAASKGTDLDTSVNNWNSPDPGPGTIQTRRPYPQYARIRMMTTDANSIYHALQTRYEHRFSRGLSITANYTWSHMIDDAAQSTNRGACTCQDPRHRGALERASSIFDNRHRLVVGYVWDVPLAKNLGGAPGLLLHGWEIGGLVTMQTGLPFNITQSGDSENVDGLWERPNLTGQPIGVANPNAAGWFNTGAFSRATTYGTTPRDAVVGPGVHTFDLSGSKSFKMPYREGHELMFRAEFFNAFNTPQLNAPGSTLGTGTFGRVTSTFSDQRQIQLALKYSF
ncbi:MAG TPA: TonB-dependent receptor [Bryobacterales bacterium]|nr:TonB-dependent receptor [Bryobacterales bacterium]